MVGGGGSDVLKPSQLINLVDQEKKCLLNAVKKEERSLLYCKVTLYFSRKFIYLRRL